VYDAVRAASYSHRRSSLKTVIDNVDDGICNLSHTVIELLVDGGFQWRPSSRNRVDDGLEWTVKTGPSDPRQNASMTVFFTHRHRRCRKHPSPGKSTKPRRS